MLARAAIGLGCLAIAFFSSDGADAEPLTMVQIGGSLFNPTVGNPSFNERTTHDNAPSSDSNGLNAGFCAANRFFLTAPPECTSLSTSASAVAGFGVLGVGTAGSSAGSNGGGGEAGGGGFALYADQLTVTSATLTPGTPVDALVYLALEGIASTTAFLSDPRGGGASASIDFEALLNVADVLLHVKEAPSSLVVSMLGHFIVGQTYELGSTLSTSVHTSTNSSCYLTSPDSYTCSNASATGVADYMHTSTTLLQPLGNFSFVAASGHDYALATNGVPEPATFALLGAGLAVLRLTRRRKLVGAGD